MSKRKPIRTRGKIQLSRYFQEFNEGESVTITKNPSVSFSFPSRMQGRTGIIGGKKGKIYIVNVKDQNKQKSFLIEPIHLKKINFGNSQ